MQNLSASLSQHVVMVKHEAHAIPVSVNSADTLAERRGQLLKGLEQDVSQDCSFQMAPQPLDHVQLYGGSQ